MNKLVFFAANDAGFGWNRKLGIWLIFERNRRRGAETDKTFQYLVNVYDNLVSESKVIISIHTWGPKVIWGLIILKSSKIAQKTIKFPDNCESESENQCNAAKYWQSAEDNIRIKKQQKSESDE